MELESFTPVVSSWKVRSLPRILLAAFVPCRAVRLDWPHAAEQEAEVKAWDGTNKRVQLAVVYPAARRMVRPVVHTALSAPVAHQHSYVASHAPHCRQSVVPEHTSRFMRFGLIERMLLGL